MCPQELEIHRNVLNKQRVLFSVHKATPCKLKVSGQPRSQGLSSYR